MIDNCSNINFSTRGFYKIGLFNMYIKGRLSFDLERLSTKDQGTFVHEYIHFLQNVTTVSGLRFSSFYVNFIIRLIRWLKEEESIVVPISFVDVCTEHNLQSDFHFFNTLSGSLNTFNFNMEQELFWKFTMHQGNEIIHLRIFDTYNVERNVLLGINAIKESMSALYQNLIDSSSYKKLYNYPYHSVSYIVKHLFPALQDDSKKLICICQIALNSSSPARDLLKWLLFASENLEKTGLELYEEHLKETYYSIDPENNNQLVKHSVKELLDLSFDGYQKKLDKILLDSNVNYSNILKITKSLTDIHLRILYSGNDLISDIKMIMKICGIPFVYNDFGERMHLAQQTNNGKLDDDISFILSLCNLCTSLFTSPTEHCRCIFRTMFCNHQFDEEELSTHTFCHDQPWKEKNCNYAHILEMLGVNPDKIQLKKYY